MSQIFKYSNIYEEDSQFIKYQKVKQQLSPTFLFFPRSLKIFHNNNDEAKRIAQLYLCVLFGNH